MSIWIREISWHRSKGETLIFYGSWALPDAPCFLLNNNNLWFYLIIIIIQFICRIYNNIVIQGSWGLRYTGQWKEQEKKHIAIAGSFGPVTFISSVSAAPGWLSTASLHLALSCSRSHNSWFFSGKELAWSRSPDPASACLWHVYSVTQINAHRS